MNGLSPGTRNNCQRTVSVLSRNYARAPPICLPAKPRGPSLRTANTDVSALRAFDGEAMGQPEMVEACISAGSPTSLPHTISEADAEFLIECTGDLPGRTAKQAACHGLQSNQRETPPGGVGARMTSGRHRSGTGEWANGYKSEPAGFALAVSGTVVLVLTVRIAVAQGNPGAVS